MIQERYKKQKGGEIPLNVMTQSTIKPVSQGFTAPTGAPTAHAVTAPTARFPLVWHLTLSALINILAKVIGVTARQQTSKSR